jgi:hypothetical protein
LTRWAEGVLGRPLQASEKTPPSAGGALDWPRARRIRACLWFTYHSRRTPA